MCTSGPGLEERGAVMDYAACNVVYVDRTAGEDKFVKRQDATSPAPSDVTNAGEFGQIRRGSSSLDHNLRTLLGTFSEGAVAFPKIELG